jgi:replicative DNA helicase
MSKNNTNKPVTVQTTTLDRLPPHSLEAEQGILGCILLSPRECLAEAVTTLPAGAEAFYDLRHQTIYTAMLKLNAEMKPIDLISLQEHLKLAGLLEQIGGIAHLSQLQDAVPSAANLDYYVSIVREKFLLRRAIRTCSGAVGRIYDYEGEVDTLLDEVEQEVLAIRQFRQNSGIKPMKELVDGQMRAIEFMVQNPGQITGLSTGFEELDQEIDGLHPADFIVVAAYPSVGKTSFSMNIVEHFIFGLGLPVGVFSAEMSASSLVRRMLCSQAKVNLRNVRRGISDSNVENLITVSSKLATAPLFIDDTSDMTIETVRAKARRMVQQHGIKLFVADYTQLFKSKDAENATKEIEQVSSGFKNLGKELDVPVILLSQLNDDGKFKGARSIGADADVVLLLKRDDKAKTEEGITRVRLKIDKQRNGEQGNIIPIDFYKAFTRFTSVPKIEPQDGVW